MELYKRDFFITRIRAGYVPVKMDDLRFKIHFPDIDMALLAQEIYIEAYETAQDEGLLTEEEMVYWLMRQKIWSEEDEKNFHKIVPEHIEYWKVELFNSLLKSNTRKQIRKYLRVAKQEYGRLAGIRRHYDYVTLDGYATYTRNLFTLSHCAKLNDEPVDWNFYSLHKLMNAYHGEMLLPEQVRELARTTPWVGLWNVLKMNGQPFDLNTLTIEQQSLLSWSNMYDKIHESPDCPPDEVLDDDDMLDGWLIIQRRKREADKKKQEIESHINPKMKNADEIIMVAETAADAQKIDMLNPTHVQNIKKQRLKHVQEQGIVREQEFKDVQQKRSMQMQQAYIQHVKGR